MSRTGHSCRLVAAFLGSSCRSAGSWSLCREAAARECPAERSAQKRRVPAAAHGVPHAGDARGRLSRAGDDGLVGQQRRAPPRAASCVLLCAPAELCLQRHHPSFLPSLGGLWFWGTPACWPDSTGTLPHGCPNTSIPHPCPSEGAEE